MVEDSDTIERLSGIDGPLELLRARVGVVEVVIAGLLSDWPSRTVVGASSWARSGAISIAEPISGIGSSTSTSLATESLSDKLDCGGLSARIRFALTL